MQLILERLLLTRVHCSVGDDWQWHWRGGRGCFELVQAANRVELDAVIARFLSDNPGAWFSVSGKIDYHHGRVRFYWLLNFANATNFLAWTMAK